MGGRREEHVRGSTGPRRGFQSIKRAFVESFHSQLHVSTQVVAAAAAAKVLLGDAA